MGLLGGLVTSRLFPFPGRSAIAFLGTGHGTLNPLVCLSKPKSQPRISRTENPCFPLF
jgi:hypothetical protein